VNRYLKKINRIHKSDSFKSSRFSKSNLLVVSLIFALMGGYLIFKSFAATTAPISSLPRVPWEGGPNYWKTSASKPQMAKADAAGWDDPSFFPITVFFGKPDATHVASLKDAGVNTFAPVEGGAPISVVTSAGLFAMPGQDAWTLAQVGNDPGVVGWFIYDECEQGEGDCWLNGDATARWPLEKSWIDKVHAYNDGRFTLANYGNGILRTFWAVDDMTKFVQGVDVSSADKYTYTSPSVASIIDLANGGDHDAPDWPNNVPIQRAYSYGWQADQMKRFQDPANLHPAWTFIETAHPFLGSEPGSTTITPGQMEGAVWSALIHEARGIYYFQHNDASSGCTATYSIVECPGVHDAVKAVDAQVKALAPVLNTQSYYNTTQNVNGFNYYRYSFNNGTDTMLKTYNGSAYIFADLGMRCNDTACTSGTVDTTGNKTFNLPSDVTGSTVTVAGENRTIPVSNGSFSDNFANEYTHHVYQITMGPPDTTAPTVSVTAPTAGATISGNVTLTANASDNIGVNSVQFKVDGNNVNSAVTTSPYTTAWDSVAIANGTHTITAVATDTSNNTTTSSSVSVTVNNIPDTTAPTVSLTAPTAGSIVSGSSVTVSANASDNVGVAGVQFKLEGANLSSEDTTSPYSIAWDTLTASNGTHTITATARDRAGNITTSSAVSVTVSNTAANLTMGFTGVGATDDTGNGGQILAQQATLSTTATIQSMSFYVGTAAGQLRLAVYDSTGAGGGPGAKLAETAEFTPVAGWNTVLTTTHPTLSAGTYWLSYAPSSSSLHFRYDSAGTFRTSTFTYAALPATFPASSTQAGQWSFYVSLTSGGGTTGPKTGDINGDNSVNITDLSLLLSSYNQNVTQCVTNTTFKCDLSSPGDGVVNIFDLSILLSHYGT
jgi:hypothetical protein